MVVIITIIPVMLCQRFGVDPCVLFHNTSLARCDCECGHLRAPALLHISLSAPRSQGGQRRGQPPCLVTHSPSSTSLPPSHGLWALPGTCNSAGSAAAARMRPGMDSLLLAQRLEVREHLPPGRVLAWHLSLLCPRAVSVSSNSDQPDGPESGKEPELAGGRAGMAAAPSQRLSPATLWLLAPSSSSDEPQTHPSSEPGSAWAAQLRA